VWILKQNPGISRLVGKRFQERLDSGEENRKGEQLMKVVL
jgi:hypothetical protein